MSPRAGLDTAAVVQAAAELANQEGLEALSLSRLAALLGVQTPSLYNHVDGLPGLHRELALLNAHRLGETLSRAAIGRSGPAAVRRMAQAFRDYIKTEPGLYWIGTRHTAGEFSADSELQQAEAQVVEVVLAVVASFGLDGEDALHAVRGLRSLVHGFATLEIAGGFGMALDCDESFRRLVEMYITGLER